MNAAAPLPEAGRLAGRCALVTGGASGIGLAVCRALRAEGAALVLLDPDPKAQDVAAALGETVVVQGSVAVRADVAAACDSALSRFGRLDIALANAGVSQNQPTLDVTDADWQRVMDVNVTGVFLTAQEAARRMLPQGRGVILLMASMYGVVAAPERVGYCVSKAGVAMMAKTLAVEWAAQGVRVNAIAPGYVRTPFLEDLAARGRVDLERLRQRTPMGRLVTVEEVADAAVFLASDQASAITGHVLGVDGGWAAYGYL